LKRASESELEREWLDFLQERKLNLPDSAQKRIDGCETRCDFYYQWRGVAVYVDGPNHDGDLARRRDAQVTDCLVHDLGLTVLRFRYDQRGEWARICDDHAYIFGKVRA
jgi:very-short-patch-repair endonuclease